MGKWGAGAALSSSTLKRRRSPLGDIHPISTEHTTACRTATRRDCRHLAVGGGCGFGIFGGGFSGTDGARSATTSVSTSMSSVLLREETAGSGCPLAGIAPGLARTSRWGDRRAPDARACEPFRPTRPGRLDPPMRANPTSAARSPLLPTMVHRRVYTAAVLAVWSPEPVTQCADNTSHAGRSRRGKRRSANLSVSSRRSRSSHDMARLEPILRERGVKTEVEHWLSRSASRDVGGVFMDTPDARSRAS